MADYKAVYEEREFIVESVRSILTDIKQMEQLANTSYCMECYEVESVYKGRSQL